MKKRRKTARERDAEDQRMITVQAEAHLAELLLRQPAPPIDQTTVGYGDTPKGRIAYISINGHTIRSNAKNGADDPPIRVARSKSDKAPVYARAVEISGPSKLVYTPSHKQLACGARLVLVADYNDVRIVR